MALGHHVRLATAVAGAAFLSACALPWGGPSRIDAGIDYQTVLSRTWATYKRDFIQSDGRVIDHSRGDVTTSEGQSYAMLRAAWMDDRETFDRVWRWDQVNLRTRGDQLLAYLWGKRGDGSWGVMDPNSAADADQDTALALLFGAKRWGAGDLRGAATAMLADIWRLEVARVGGSSLVSAGSWAVSQAGGTVVNPSYLAPYAYRAFAKVDGSHPWADLVPASYRLLRTASTADLGGTRSAGLPPNWCVVDGSGTPRHYQGQDAADDYGYDAFRVPWRVAVDWSWNRSPEARDYLGGLSALRDAWSRSGSLAADYHRDGSAAGDPDPAAYGADLGAFMADPRAAADLLKRGLMSTYHSEGDSAWWGDRRSYYAQNWAWFGVALAAGRITDLSR